MNLYNIFFNNVIEINMIENIYKFCDFDDNINKLDYYVKNKIKYNFIYDLDFREYMKPFFKIAIFYEDYHLYAILIKKINEDDKNDADYINFAVSYNKKIFFYNFFYKRFRHDDNSLNLAIKYSDKDVIHFMFNHNFTYDDNIIKNVIEYRDIDCLKLLLNNGVIPTIDIYVYSLEYEKYDIFKWFYEKYKINLTSSIFLQLLKTNDKYLLEIAEKNKENFIYMYELFR